MLWQKKHPVVSGTKFSELSGTVFYEYFLTSLSRLGTVFWGVIWESKKISGRFLVMHSGFEWGLITVMEDGRYMGYLLWLNPLHLYMRQKMPFRFIFSEGAPTLGGFRYLSTILFLPA